MLTCNNICSTFVMSFSSTISESSVCVALSCRKKPTFCWSAMEGLEDSKDDAQLLVYKFVNYLSPYQLLSAS